MNYIEQTGKYFLGDGYLITGDIEGKRKQIRYLSPESSPGCTVTPYEFIEEHEDIDGAVFTIQPFNATNVNRITGPIVFHDAPIWGSGHFIGINPQGNLAHFVFGNVHLQKFNSRVRYEYGWQAICWIAANSGLEVVSINRPKFQEPFEKHIELNSPELPLNFWKMYWKLRGYENYSQTLKIG